MYEPHDIKIVINCFDNVCDVQLKAWQIGDALRIGDRKKSKTVSPTQYLTYMCELIKCNVTQPIYVKVIG